MSQEAVELAKAVMAYTWASENSPSASERVLARALLAERERAERWKMLAVEAVTYWQGDDGPHRSPDELLADMDAALAAEKEGA